MKTSEIFDALLDNLKVGDESAVIAARRDEITKALNKNFRDKTGCTDYRLMVGSYGRHTAIRGVSDLDLIFILPSGLKSSYSTESGPRRILERVRDVLKARYSTTTIKVDQCVVRVQFANFKFEVQPAFELSDESFEYPDAVAQSWKVTKPRSEINASAACNQRTSTNMRRLARMARAWKNTNGVNMGGLLIDTLVYRFFDDTDDYDAAGTDSCDAMARDFFKFLSDEPNKDYYLALGSNQRVRVHARFQAKAKKAYNRCLEAIENEGKAAANKKWREVFGKSVPLAVSEAKFDFKNTEEFIENTFPVDIRESVTIDCDVTQAGWRPKSLRDMLTSRSPLFPQKELNFKISSCSAVAPYDVRWKVLNQGVEAERRDCIRGQILKSNRPHDSLHERTSFRGEHFVECYIIQDGIVVARDLIEVPITTLDGG